MFPSSLWEDSTERTALHLSSIGGHVDDVKKHLRHFNVNAKDRDGYTALHYAARNGHRDIVNILLKSYAEVDVRNWDGWTPLNLSAYYGHTQIVETLIAAGADINAKVDCINAFTPTHHGATPLIKSARGGHLGAVKALIAAGADVNAKDGLFSHTALHECARSGNVKILKALIDAGADISARNNAGETPLCMAIRYDNKMENWKFLIRHTILMDSESNEIEYITGEKKFLVNWNSCKKQVLRMRETKLGDSSVSFITFLTETDEEKLFLYFSKGNFGLRDELQRDRYKRMFSKYAEDIEDQYRKGGERTCLLDESANLMTAYFSKKLPIEVCRMISEYLTNDDLMCFVSSSKCKDGSEVPHKK